MNSLLRPDRRQGGVVMLGCVWEPSCLFSFLSFRYLGVLFVHRTSLSFSRTQKDREIKWCRVSPRGLNVSARARASYFFVVALNNVGQTHASSRTNDSHTHPRKKKTETKTKKSLTWSPCQSHTSAREFNNSSIRLSLRNPLHSSRDTLAFSLTYINVFRGPLPSPLPLPVPFLSSPRHCASICSSDRRVFGVWIRSPDPCLLLGLNSLRWK